MPIPKKGDPTECGNYRTILLISQANKILLKIIQKWLQQCINRELPEIQASFRRECGTRNIIADVRWILAESREYQKDVYLCFIDYAKAFDCVDHNKPWITLRRMGIPEHLIVLIRNLYIDKEAVVQREQGDTEWFKVRKGVCQGFIFSPYLFNLYAEQIIQGTGLYEEYLIRISGGLISKLHFRQPCLSKMKRTNENQSLQPSVWIAPQHKRRVRTTGP